MLKCPKCGLTLRTLETRKTDKWVRRTKMCQNKHKAVTRQIYGEWEEKIVRLKHFEPHVKRNMSSVNLSRGVENILKMWAESGEPQLKPI